jgi:transposase
MRSLTMRSEPGSTWRQWVEGIDTRDRVSYTRRMAMGKRKRRAHQASMWVAAQDLPRSAAHPFYRRLNRVLDEAQFDAFVESACVTFYAPVMGRPSLAPGRYFRLLLLGYFEGLDSERAIAWRAADSLSVRSFLGLELEDRSPDHSTISRTRRLIDIETHRAVFTWILQRLANGGLVKGQTIGIDATTLEANAALRCIVRRDTGEDYQEFLTQLAQASGIETPTREDLARIDRQRPKKGSNAEWTHPHDPDAKITKMKDGRTHLAHKAEHAVDLETGAVVAVTVQSADVGDPATSVETLIEAAEQIETVVPDGDGPTEVVADKGYHSNQVMVDLEAVGLRSYIAEPERGRRRWTAQPEARDAVYRNRRRIRGARGRRLLRQRGEHLERPFAHLYGTGRLRRVYLRGHPNILKRVLVHAGACNLGLLMRTRFGIGTPRGLQSRRLADLFLIAAIWQFACRVIARLKHLRAPPVHRRHAYSPARPRPFITSAVST